VGDDQKKNAYSKFIPRTCRLKDNRPTLSVLSAAKCNCNFYSMDIVYIVGSGSFWKDNELRYSLRSAQKHVKGFRNIYIIGHCPDFLKGENLLHLPSPDYRNIALYQKNVYDKLFLACRQENISESFFFCNDDYFFLRDFELSEFPVCYNGFLEDRLIRDLKQNPYKNTLRNTIELLVRNNRPTRNFELHQPCIINKKLFIEIMSRFDWSKLWSYVIKSLYFNMQEAGELANCTIASDSKIQRPFLTASEFKTLLQNRFMFSTNEHINDGMKYFLSKTFPVASPWEK
jgi:hypothetical protein